MPVPPFVPPLLNLSAVIHRRPWEYGSVEGSGAIGVESVQRWTVENAPGHCESVGATVGRQFASVIAHTALHPITQAFPPIPHASSHRQSTP